MCVIAHVLARVWDCLRWVLVCDLGSDVVWVYSFDTATGALGGASTSTRHLRLPKGSGPRHLDFHPSGDYVYVTLELSGHVVACSWGGKDGSGRLEAFQTVYALPDGVVCSREGSRGNADIHCSADGRHVFATTRTDHSIVTFGVEPADGSLTLLHRVHSGGQTPRHFHLDDRGGNAWCRVVNQDGVARETGDTGCVTVFKVTTDGQLVEPKTHLVDGCPAVITRPVFSPHAGANRGRI
eukprot:SAG31_NODE_9003_length_1349_cov_1.544800_2_plen_239_part_00